LHEAARTNVGVVKLLLDKGADVNAQDSAGETALWYAASKGHTDIVRLLLDRGAGVNVKNYLHRTALVLAVNADIAKLLLDKGADLNATDSYGRTPLSYAGIYRRDDVVKTLLDHGANLESELSRCERTFAEWSKSSNRYLRKESAGARHCVELLKEIKSQREEAKRQEQEIVKARIIQTQKAKEMKEIIKEVMAETAKTQKQTVKSPAMQSEIDKPIIAASEKIMGDNDIAIIIGIEGYQSLPKSDYSYDDAKLVKDYIRALGFRERNIELLTDEKATLSGIVKSVDVWLKNKTKPGSRVFVYYSGHGAPAPSSGEAYLVPYDGDPNYLAVTGYSLKRLYQTLGKLDAREVVVVLDSCFSGAGGRSVLAKGARPLVMMTSSIIIPKNIAVLSATQGSQISTSSPEKGHGVFTYYFLKAIKEGRKNLAEIYEYIKPQVEDEAKQLNVQQSPSISPDIQTLKGRFELRK